MRMFLIGMCDIFLLLYLTAVAEVDSRPMSSLTVDDYTKLEVSAAELRATSAALQENIRHQQAILERKEVEVREQERRTQEALRQVRALEARSAEAIKEASQTKEGLSAAQQRLANAEAARAELEAEYRTRLQVVAASEASLRAETVDVATALTEARRARDVTSSRLEEVSRQVAEAQAAAQQGSLRSEVERKRADEALAQGQRLQREAELARREAEQARRKEAESNLVAARARAREAAALEYAEQAVSTAASARDHATRAMQRAATVGREREAAVSRLSSVEKPLAVAYLESIEPTLVELRIKLQSDGGRSRDSLVRGPAVDLEGSRVLFVPFSALGLSGREAIRKIQSVSSEQVQWSITQGFVSAENPDLLAFALPDEVAACEVSKAQEPRALMPTLILVHGEVEKQGRIRAFADEYHALPRDELGLGATNRFMRSKLPGAAGRQQGLHTGDHLLNPDGSYIGVVVRSDEIAQTMTLRGWERVSF